MITAAERRDAEFQSRFWRLCNVFKRTAKANIAISSAIQGNQTASLVIPKRINNPPLLTVRERQAPRATIKIRMLPDSVSIKEFTVFFRIRLTSSLISRIRLIRKGAATARMSKIS